MKPNVYADRRVLTELAQRLADKYGHTFRFGRYASNPQSGNGALAIELGVSWGRLKMWRVYRGVPGAYRYRVFKLAKKYKVQITEEWIEATMSASEQSRRHRRQRSRG